MLSDFSESTERRTITGDVFKCPWALMVPQGGTFPKEGI